MIGDFLAWLFGAAAAALLIAAERRRRRRREEYREALLREFYEEGEGKKAPLR